MISPSSSSSLMTYVPCLTSEEFLASEYDKSIHKFVKNFLFPSPQSSLSTIISFGSESSIYLDGSSLFSVFCEKVNFADSTHMSIDPIADLLVEELAKLEIAYECALYTKNNTQKLCVKLQKITEDIPKIVFASLKISNPISTPIWENLLKTTHNRYKKTCVLFYEATQALVKIESQLVELSKLVEKILSNYKQ